MALSVDNQEQLLAHAAKATQEKTSYWQRHTPENSPEPEIRELPKETHNDNEKQERLINLINHIQNAGDNPYNILEVKSSTDFDSRTPRLLKTLEEAEAKNVDGAKDALTKARDAQKTLDLFFRECQKETKRVLEQNGSSYQVVLQTDKGGTPDERYQTLATFVNPVVFKGEGVDDALKVLDKAIEEARAEDVSMEDGEDGHIQPDTNTISLYEEATPIVLRYLRNLELDATNIKNDLDEINRKISVHNASLGDDSKELMIDTHGLHAFIQQARPDLKLLKSNPQNERALEGLKKTQAELLEFNKDNHYPTSWVFPLPGSSPLEQMLAKAPVSTVMDVKFPPGETFDGGKILRYNEFFVKRVPVKNERGKILKDENGDDIIVIESAVYNFLVEIEGRYYIKTGKEIGKAATTAYVAEENPNKFKMGTYYGEKRHGIKYNKAFFKYLQNLEKQTGKQHLYFMGAARKSSETKSGRTMPSEHCVIGIKHPDIGEWYDVFTRSKLVQLYGDDMSHRISQYWKDLGEKPSQRRPVQKDEEATSANTASAALQKDFDKFRDKLSNLECMFETLVDNMAQLTTSFNDIKHRIR